jgi:hypothetical protein
MRTIIITGSAGEEADVVGIDNDMRAAIVWSRSLDKKVAVIGLNVMT